MQPKSMAAQGLPFVFFGAAFFFGPLSQLDFLAMMPGNLGDARLNNYFLEHIYLFFFEGSNSLWHLPFFSPFPYVLGFSDNLFGAAPVYAMARWIVGDADTAFQIWFLFAYLANFIAARYALKRLDAGDVGATLGSLIFTFALPVTAHAGHAQLHYRFGLPLAAAFFASFLTQKDWRFFLVACIWLIWQFYCGIYIGFFTALLLVAQLAVYLLLAVGGSKKGLAMVWADFSDGWKRLEKKEKILFLIFLFSLAFLLALLFFPYLRVSRLYGAKRTWQEIETMLPRPQSYFLADASAWWSNLSRGLGSDIPMRHEHQMFLGILPLLLAALGFIFGIQAGRGEKDFFPLLAGSLAVVVVLTIYVSGYSIWYFFYRFPGASAIRAMSRIDLAILFPVAYLSALAVDELSVSRKRRLAVGALLFSLLVLESSSTKMDVSFKSEWRLRLVQADARIQQPLQSDSIIFMAQETSTFFVDELDAMWVALHRRVKTLNGYTGGLPPGFAVEYGRDCSELPRRVLSYLIFKRDSENIRLYQNLMSRVVPIGFLGCEKNWVITPPRVTSAARPYSREEIGSLHYEVKKKYESGNKAHIEIRIVNNGETNFSALSSVGWPLRLSWRFLDREGEHVAGFEARKDLRTDIPPKGEISMQIPVEHPVEVLKSILELALVQEGEFWAHDVGVPVARPSWN
ncbi:hypothetical protein [Variovorax gossypii]